MAHRSHCHTCKFAEWPTNKSGRRNPNRPGVCTWEADVRVPHAFDTNTASTGETDIVLRLRAKQGIWWKDSVTCPVYQRKPD